MAANDSTWQMVTVKPWILLVLLAACDQGRVATDTDAPQVFHQLCATCHGPKGKPTESMVARLNVRDLTAPELRARITPALVEHQIRHGSENKLMPSFEHAMSDEQIKALAAYVASPEFLQQ